MARHKRYQSKRHHGYSNSSCQASKSSRINKFPAKPEDDQPVPKAVREIQKRMKDAKNNVNVKRKKRVKNRLLEESTKMGYQQRPWENPERLFARVEKDTQKFVREEFMKARYGMAGRSEKEIAKDYKELDEKERRKKLQRIAEQEKKRKLQEKESKWRKTAKKLDHPDGYDFEDEEPEKADEGDDDQGIEDEEDDTPGPIRKETSPKKKPEKTKKRLGKNEKIRLKKKIQHDDEEKDLILNAREIIPFGERADEPPKLPPLKKMRLLDVKAGSKDLLLKSLLSKPEGQSGEASNKITYSSSQSTKSAQRVSDAERQRIIDLYRKTKKKTDMSTAEVSL